MISLATGERSGRTHPRLVECANHHCQRADLVLLADRGEVAERAGGDDSARTCRVHVHRGLSGDLGHGLSRLKHRLRVGVEGRNALGRRRGCARRS